MSGCSGGATSPGFSSCVRRPARRARIPACPGKGCQSESAARSCRGALRPVPFPESSNSARKVARLGQNHRSQSTVGPARSLPGRYTDVLIPTPFPGFADCAPRVESPWCNSLFVDRAKRDFPQTSGCPGARRPTACQQWSGCVDRIFRPWHRHLGADTPAQDYWRIWRYPEGRDLSDRLKIRKGWIGVKI